MQAQEAYRAFEYKAAFDAELADAQAQAAADSSAYTEMQVTRAYGVFVHNIEV